MTRHIRLLALLASAALGACSRFHGLPAVLPLGTWGGPDAGLIATESETHVHVGCTRGDVPGRIPIAADGTFQVDGRHNVNAFPVDQGIYHPARFTGRLHGDDRLTLEVVLLDTGQRLGPAEVFLDREPQMRECPICRDAPADLPAP
jgi:hypothetical protein